jgi:integrase/recombinase XerD
MGLEDILNLWRNWQESANLSQRTIDERAAVVRRYIAASGELPLEFTPFGIRKWLGRRTIKPGTRMTYARALRAYCGWLTDEKLRTDDPTKEVPKQHAQRGQPRPVSDRQLASILAACPTPRTRTQVILGAMVGLRVHEIAKVHGRDIDWEEPVSLSVFGKGSKEATVQLNDVVVGEAEKYPRDDWWFPNADGSGPITRQAVAKNIKDAMNRAGVRATPHALRHYFATTLLDRDVNLRVVQELMRHASIASTQVYTQVSKTQRAAAVNQLGLPVDA